MQITLNSYINNPTGSRARMVGERQAASATYSDKFEKLLLKSAGAIEYHIFKTAVDPNRVDDKKPNSNIDRYIIIIKIPSESIPRVVYDVAVEFYTKDTVYKKSSTLDEYYVKFFSNDPNFNYTYAYSFKKNKLIIDELMGKLDPKAMKEKPKVTNPNTLIGYVKSIYFAYLFIESRGLMNKFNWYGAPPINIGKLNGLVMSTSNKLVQVQKLKTLYNATKKGTMVINNIDDLDSLAFKEKKIKTTKATEKAYEKVKVANAKRSSFVTKSKTVSKVSSVKKVKR